MGKLKSVQCMLQCGDPCSGLCKIIQVRLGVDSAWDLQPEERPRPGICFIPLQHSCPLLLAHGTSTRVSQQIDEYILRFIAEDGVSSRLQRKLAPACIN